MVGSTATPTSFAYKLPDFRSVHCAALASLKVMLELDGWSQRCRFQQWVQAQLYWRANCDPRFPRTYTPLIHRLQLSFASRFYRKRQDRNHQPSNGSYTQEAVDMP